MKKASIKALALILCLATLASLTAVFTSCGKKEKEEVKMTVIVDGSVSEYTIIRPDKADDAIISLTMELRAAIVDNCGCEINLDNDWYKKGEELDPNTKEILIGNTNRPETAEVLETLAPNNWAVVNKGNKIVICATNDTLLSLAVDWFIKNCIFAEDKTVKVPETLVKVEGFDGDLPISIGGVSGYQIVYPKGSELLEHCAEILQRKTRINGQNIPVVTDEKEATDNEIVIGTTNRGGAAPSGKNEYSIKTEGSKVYITASDEDTVYYAVNYYIENALSVGDTVVSAPDDFKYSGTLNNYYADGWELGLPYIEKGTVAPVYNTGSGLESDMNANTPSDSYMHLVSNVTYDDFTNYTKKLESFGFENIYNAKTEENELVGYRFGAAYAYVHYAPKQNYIRVIWDRSSTCEVSDIEYTSQQTGATTFYQYSIDYSNAELCFSSSAMNCGMLYIVKLSDNSLIMVDSGSGAQASEASLNGLYKFLYDITGTDADKPLNIRLWYFTHPHGDHVELAFRLLDYISSKGYVMPDVKALAFEFPSQRAHGNYGKEPSTYTMTATFEKYYPNIDYLKLHMGMVFNVGEVKFEVLSTIETLVDLNSQISGYYGPNDTCTLVRLWIDGKSIFLAGDTANNQDVQTRYMPLYTNKYFKSDFLQASHHGYNYATQLYRGCDPTYILVPNSYANNIEGFHNRYANMVGEDNVFYAGNYTAAIAFSGGNVTITKIPRYDHPTGELDPSVR